MYYCGSLDSYTTHHKRSLSTIKFYPIMAVSIPYTTIDMVIVTVDAVLCTLAILTWLTILIARYCHTKCEATRHDANEMVTRAKAVANKVYEHRFSFKRRRHFIVRTLVPILKRGPDDRPDQQQTILLKHVVPEFYIEQLLLFCFILLALISYVFMSSYTSSLKHLIAAERLTFIVLKHIHTSW